MKKKYDIILFDADRTLYDFDKSEETALRLLLESLGFELTESTYSLYKKINSELWAEFERGERKNSTIAPTRFTRFFQALDLPFDPEKAADDYFDLLSRQQFLIFGAYGLCEKLYGKVDMYIVTNGVEKVQTRRFQDSRLAPFFKGVFISEALGAAKPSHEFYDRVLEKIGNPPRDKILTVGDSATADIKGANNAELDACYFSPKSVPLPDGIHAEYIVSTLSEIENIIL